MKDYILNLDREKVQLSKYKNSWFKPGPMLKIVAWHFISSLFFNNKFSVFNCFKCLLLKLFGARVGKGVILKRSIKIKYPWLLTIGDYVWIGEKVWIDNLAPVIISNNVFISQGAYILTGNHNYKSSSFDLLIKPVTLEDGVWLGARSIVCPGVTCKTHSILTVGSVAKTDLEPFSVYQGVPATVKKMRTLK